MITFSIFAPRTWLRVFKRTGKKRCALPAEVEAAERASYLSYLKPGMVAFDVGTFRGDATLLFPGGHRYGKAEFSMHLATPVGR